jgi:hypothetical protein
MNKGKTSVASEWSVLVPGGQGTWLDQGVNDLPKMGNPIALPLAVEFS